jgi:hypothetical protein
MRDTVSAGGMMAKETGIAMGSVFRAHDGPEEKEGMGKGDGLGDIAVPFECPACVFRGRSSNTLKGLPVHITP